MKVCIIGHGSIGKRHERILKEWFGITPTIVRRGAPLPNADLAMICTPSDSHVPIALACAQRDMALFIEKPLSNSCYGLDELQEVVDEKELPTYVAYPLRHHPDVQLAYGEIRALRCNTNHKLWPSKRKIDHVLLELSHELDLVHVFGAGPLHGTCLGNYAFYGGLGMVDLALNVNSPAHEREIATDDGHTKLLITNDVYVRQFEWFLGNMDYNMMNNIREARVLLEKILGFIDGQ